MILIKCLYFMLPAYLANMAPIFAQRAGILKFLSKPVDGGRKINGEPIFGENKTWRGFAVGIIVAIFMIWIQYFLYKIPFFENWSLLNYSEINLWFGGFLFGFGALFGDLVKSFFKRRFRIQSGTPWIPFDQMDFILGSLIFILPVYFPSLLETIIILAASPFLHILANNLGFYLQLKKTKW